MCGVCIGNKIAVPGERHLGFKKYSTDKIIKIFRVRN